MSVVDAVLRLLKKEEDRLDKELAGITAAIAAFGKTYVNGNSAQSVSATRRRRIAVAPKAQSARGRKTGKVVPIKSKTPLSGVAAKKASSVQKARSAKAKAAKKSA